MFVSLRKKLIILVTCRSNYVYNRRVCLVRYEELKKDCDGEQKQGLTRNLIGRFTGNVSRNFVGRLAGHLGQCVVYLAGVPCRFVVSFNKIF